MLREEDIQEIFVRSGGKGGQNVNKVSTCVILKHRPTGIIVRCETERSQARNRILARQRLAERLAQMEREKKAAARNEFEKSRRQKRRPGKAARLRNVETKRHRGEIKKNRKRPGSGDW